MVGSKVGNCGRLTDSLLYFVVILYFVLVFWYKRMRVSNFDGLHREVLSIVGQNWHHSYRRICVMLPTQRERREALSIAGNRRHSYRRICALLPTQRERCRSGI